MDIAQSVCVTYFSVSASGKYDIREYLKTNMNKINECECCKLIAPETVGARMS